MESLDIGYDDTRFTNVVDEDLHCAICLNVLKEPMQCQTNEHHFCAPCIKRHLGYFQTCPSCMEALTLDTLKKPSRFLARSLSELVIRCEYVDRGCPEVMSLSDLKTHSAKCEYSPVKCSNEGCNEVIIKREKMHHERETCKFRKLKCKDCRETRRDIDEIKVRLGQLSLQKHQISQMLAQMNYLTLTIKMLCPENAGSKEDIIVAGGRNNRRLNSVEKYSWSSGSWQKLQSMGEIRSAASCVVYENKMVVAGGLCEEVETNSMEAFNFDNGCDKWCGFLPKLPSKQFAHETVIYKDRLLLIGGRNNRNEVTLNTIYEIFLTPPYSSSLVCHMPQPVHYHGAERFGNHVFILGGILTGSNEFTDTVIKYDIKSRECTNMPSLPFGVGCMATVKWKCNILVIGGESANSVALNTVILYDIKSGENQLLPNMKYSRRGCSAVITQDTVVVMGGVDENDIPLCSTESFSFDCYCWDELTSMTEPRAFATAVVKCNNFA